ncbi:MAG TPA: hypothetical protein VGV93_11375, partial [Acidimicrobiales bacterium]|nr:hypothetical protein [Acidimicrobiales bacterium]
MRRRPRDGTAVPGRCPRGLGGASEGGQGGRRFPVVSGRLIYVVNCSLDGYIEDADGGFGWSEPDEELHQFFNDLLRPIGSFLYGRRLYESMAVWETDPSLAAESPVMADFAAVWQDADKIVYSTTLEAPITERTRIERVFDPDAVRGVKAAAATDLLIGNAT